MWQDLLCFGCWLKPMALHLPSLINRDASCSCVRYTLHYSKECYLHGLWWHVQSYIDTTCTIVQESPISKITSKFLSKYKLELCRLVFNKSLIERSTAKSHETCLFMGTDSLSLEQSKLKESWTTLFWPFMQSLLLNYALASATLENVTRTTAIPAVGSPKGLEDNLSYNAQPPKCPPFLSGLSVTGSYVFPELFDMIWQTGAWLTWLKLLSCVYWLLKSWQTSQWLNTKQYKDLTASLYVPAAFPSSPRLIKQQILTACLLHAKCSSRYHLEQNRQKFLL